MRSLFIIMAVLRVAFLGDPQVDNEQQVYYAQKAIQEVRAREDIDLVVVLGDLVNDKTQYLGAMKASLDSLRCPWVCVPGNHDRDVYHVKGKPRDMASFRRTLGYVDTTFVFRGVRFICMDDVRNSSKGGYEGGFREDQKDWLRGVMSKTPKHQRTVLVTHIPISEFSAKDSLAAILKGHDNLLEVCGHTHTVERSALKCGNMTFEEIIGGTLCGMWWRGPKGSDGIPYALMNCGAPRGYFTADFRHAGKSRSWYTLTYKCIGRPSEDQMSARIKDGKLIVNVYGGSLDGCVKLLSGADTYTLTRRALPAPEVEDVIDWNTEKGRAYFREHRDEWEPMRNLKSPHVWAMDLDGISLAEEITLTCSDPAMNCVRNFLLQSITSR